MMNESVRPCPRCGPGQSYDSFTRESIAARLAEIPIDPALAAEAVIFNRRLDECDKCDALREGILCSHCGCFVMFRARPLKSRCPHPSGNKWADN